LRGQSQGTEEPRQRQAVAARGDTEANRGGTAQTSAPPRAPSWVPLNPSQQRYLDQLLDYWEHKSSQIERYRCKFRRWEYDPVFGPKEKFKTYSEGIVKYSAPDKGLFRVEKMSQYQPAEQEGGEPEYVQADQAEFEHWICDGEWVYQMDYQRKRLVQTQLPPRMRGKAIGKGPLPFLFNAKADDIKRRFWIHVITPPDAQGEYWLEAVPRTREDAGNFKKIHVIISEGDYLPKAMVLFDQSTSSRGNPPRTTFEFIEREVNFNILAEKLNLFHREFYEPSVPSGWEKDVRKWNQPSGQPRQASGASGKAERAETSNR
ncbi:MAG: TIGR03009 domain-containing protein, partial [Pirellulaceae bacterium]